MPVGGEQADFGMGMAQQQAHEVRTRVAAGAEDAEVPSSR
jgi:hypothetical protein